MQALDYPSLAASGACAGARSPQRMHAPVVCWLALLLVVGACGRPAPRAPVDHASSLAAPADSITAPLLRAHVAELASDRYEGRGPGTRGGELAMAYLEQQLHALGFEPGAADGSYRQRFGLVGLRSQPPSSWSFAQGARALSVVDDQYIMAVGDQQPSTDVRDAEVVFVGYGIQAPEHGWDDFKRADLRGKVLLMLNNDPDWDPELFGGERRLYYGRWTYKYESAARQGAAGAIIVHTTPSAGYPFTVVQTSWSGEQFELPREQSSDAEPRLRFRAWLTEPATRALLGLANQDLDALIERARSKEFVPVSLGVRTSVRFATEVRRAESANVIGKLTGSDPALRDEAVIYTAHHDHLGLGKPDARGDRIYNGALDNAAGVAQVLGIATALKRLRAPPRRSVLIMFVGAEEQGLLGSQYYALHPTFAPGAIAANVNYDFGNIWGRARDISLVGMEKSTLGALVAEAARAQGRVVRPDALPDRGYYYRSDHFSFARIGVPGASFSEGMEIIDRPAGWGRAQIEQFEAERYHQPSDELDESWDFSGMVEDARLGLAVGVAIADADALPSWTPGDEFEAAREAALRARASGAAH